MASKRNALVSSYNYLSRRLYPSFLHTVQDDRELTRSPQSPQLTRTHLVQQVIIYSRPFGVFKSPVRDRRTVGVSITLGIDQSSRRFSSSADGSNEIGYIKDVAEVLTDTGVEAGIVAVASSVPAPFPGEVTVAAADSFLPVAALQHVIDAVHSFTGFNWWASIALTTVLIRCATVPLLINQLKATSKLNVMRPELEKLKEEMNNNMNEATLMENQRRMKALFKKHGVTPFTPLKGILIQGPVFISFFMAIRNMVEKVPSFQGGGAFWFTDLTTPDAMYILPVLTALSFLVTVELNMQEGLEGNPMATTMKKFSRGLGVLTIPFTASFPKAIFCYWVTSNLFSLVYGIVLKRPPVRKFLNLPDTIVPSPKPSSPQPSFSLFGGLRQALPSASASTASTPVEEKGCDQIKSAERRAATPSSTAISQRIRSLEKTVKSRNKSKRR